MNNTLLAAALATSTLSLTTLPATAASFTTEVPICSSPTAPAAGCQLTAPLDLRGVTAFRLYVQARNYSPTDPSDATLAIQFSTPGGSIACFGAPCPTITIPNAVPPNGSCCGPWFTTTKIAVPLSERINNVNLRIAITGGQNLNFTGAMHPLIQLYY